MYFVMIEIIKITIEVINTFTLILLLVRTQDFTQIVLVY